MDNYESPERPSGRVGTATGAAGDLTGQRAVRGRDNGHRGGAPLGDNGNSGVGVLDKAVAVLAAVESGPATLAQLVTATGLARPTTHRIAVALEPHRLLTRDVQGRFVLGPRVGELASAAGEDR